MSHTVLGLGAAALTAAGSVWWLPAAADLRAGDDRPLSNRTAARACLLWWGTCALLVLVLPTTSSWDAPGAVAAAGAAGAAALRVRAWLLRRYEQQEEAHRWASLGMAEAGRAATGGPSRYAVLGWLLTGMAVASLTAVALLATARPGGALPAAAAAMVALFFLVVGTARPHAPRGGDRPHRTS